MANIKPFKAIRPTVDKAHLVASRSVDRYNKQELNQKLQSNPLSFLHIINPDFEDGQTTKSSSIERLRKVKNKFKKFIKENIFLKEEKPSFYLYRQTGKNVHCTGIIASISVDDYTNGTIKIHEQTLTKKEEKLMQYLDYCEFNAEPVLFFYQDDQIINQFINTTIATQQPIYNFTTSDLLQHEVWKITDVKLIEKQFGKMNKIYIADGHHRSASSVLLAKNRREKLNTKETNAQFNYYLGAFFASSQLKIFNYNRIVTDLNNLTKQEVLTKLQTNFDFVTELEPHKISLYFEKKWHHVKLKETFFKKLTLVQSLDVSIVTNYILAPIFNIQDLKTDKRVTFINGTQGKEVLESIVNKSKGAMAIHVNAVTMEQLINIADNNEIMPPKSTWIEPKLRSGLLVYSIEE